MKRLLSILAFFWAFVCVAAAPAVIVDQGKSPPPFDGINLPAIAIQAPATVSNSMSVFDAQPFVLTCAQVYENDIPVCATVPEVKFVSSFERIYSSLLLIKPPGDIWRGQCFYITNSLYLNVVPSRAQYYATRASIASGGNFCNHIFTASSTPFY